MLRIGHRGAPRIAPANTLASFAAAHQLGCDWVECDCRASADGIIVLAHDPTICDRHGDIIAVNEHTAAELAGLDLGRREGVPTLADLVRWAVGRVGVMADVKCGGREREIGEALAPLSADQTIVSGADADSRRRFRSLFDDLPISRTVDAAAESDLIRDWDALDTEALTLEYPLVTQERVVDLHRRGIRVYVWTVDDFEAMRRLAAMGVDGIISNRADLLALVPTM